MSRIDFYVLPQAGEDARMRFACRLAEKAYRLEHRVHLLTADEGAAKRLDELLWSFRDGSFVPHDRLGAGQPVPEAPVTLSAAPELPESADLLINLAANAAPAGDAFPRIAELVTSDEKTRTDGRRRFAAYRDRGHDIETHKL